MLLDSPASKKATHELLEWLNIQKITLKAIIVNHFHDDCTGFLNVFHDRLIPSYGTSLCKTLAIENGNNSPTIIFHDSLKISVLKSIELINVYFGRAHTSDNIVSYIPADSVLFGGCMIKSLGAKKGNVQDSDIKAWPTTVRNVQDFFPHIKIVVPGHGSIGDKELLNYTINLFEN